MDFLLPEMGEAYEVEVVGWLVKPGDTVAARCLLEMTDKATMEFPAPFAGKITTPSPRSAKNKAARWRAMIQRHTCKAPQTKAAAASVAAATAKLPTRPRFGLLPETALELCPVRTVAAGRPRSAA